MSEHTKGPLTVRHGVDGDYHVDSPDGYAGFATCWGKDDVAKANAYLYAAAPDLLQALDSLRTFMWAEGFADQTPNMAKADAAIAKAEGK